MITLDKAHAVLITMPGTQEERHHLKDLTDDKAKMCNNESSSQRNGKNQKRTFLKIE